MALIVGCTPRGAEGHCPPFLRGTRARWPRADPAVPTLGGLCVGRPATTEPRPRGKWRASALRFLRSRGARCACPAPREQKRASEFPLSSGMRAKVLRKCQM